MSATGNAQRKTHSARRTAHSAFTFVELFLVVIIIGVLIGISLPRLRIAFDSLQLDSFSRELQSLMNYLRERSIVEGKVICLNIDDENKEIWANIQGVDFRLKTLAIGDDIKIESENKQIIFYPDGEIDKVTIDVSGSNNQKVSLTTKGVFGGVKLLPQE